MAEGHQLSVLRQSLERLLLEDRIVLHAQVSAAGFYLRHGYVAEGPRFEEAGIDTMKVRFDPKQPELASAIRRVTGPQTCPSGPIATPFTLVTGQMQSDVEVRKISSAL